MKKRTLTMLLAASMALTATACGSGTSSSDTDSSKADESKSSSEASSSGETKHLILAFPTWSGAPADIQKVQDAMNEITLDKLGIDVEFQVSDAGTYKQNMTLALSSGEQLDIMSTVLAGYTSLVQQGYLSDLEENDLLKTSGAGIISTMGQDFIDACRINGTMYGLPNNRDVAQGRGCAAIATEYLTGIGYDVTSDKEIIKITQEELNDIYAQLHTKYPDLEVYRPSTLSMSQFSNVDLLGGSAFGVLLNYGAELKTVNLFTSDFYKNYCSKMYNYNQSGYISADAATDTTAVGELVKAGTLMSYTTGGKPGSKQQESNLCGRAMTIFQTLDDYISSNSIASFPWTIPINTVDATASMQYLNELYTNPELADLLGWGIKDTHYKVLDDDRIDYADGIDGKTSGYNHTMGWMMPNQFITHVWNGNSVDLWSQIKTFNNDAQKSKACGFTYDSSASVTQITAVQNVYDEYQKSLEYGFVDPATGIKEMNDKMMDAGLQTIINDKQTQLDAWAAK